MNEKMIIDSNSGIAANSVGNIFYNAPNPQMIKNSIMANILKQMLENNLFESTTDEYSVIPYDVCAKIEYNNVIKYKQLIDDNSIYYYICNQIVNTLDDLKVGTKKTIFSSVHTRYLLTKGSLVKKYSSNDTPEMDIIKSYSDDILDGIFSYYINEAQRYQSLEGYTYEEIEAHIQAFLTYCFIECKILERPKVG